MALARPGRSVSLAASKCRPVVSLDGQDGDSDVGAMATGPVLHKGVESASFTCLPGRVVATRRRLASGVQEQPNATWASLDGLNVALDTRGPAVAVAVAVTSRVVAGSQAPATATPQSYRPGKGKANRLCATGTRQRAHLDGRRPSAVPPCRPRAEWHGRPDSLLVNR